MVRIAPKTSWWCKELNCLQCSGAHRIIYYFYSIHLFILSLSISFSFLDFGWHQEYIEVPSEEVDIIEELLQLNKRDEIKKLERKLEIQMDVGKGFVCKFREHFKHLDQEPHSPG